MKKYACFVLLALTLMVAGCTAGTLTVIAQDNTKMTFPVAECEFKDNGDVYAVPVELGLEVVLKDIRIAHFSSDWTVLHPPISEDPCDTYGGVLNCFNP